MKSIRVRLLVAAFGIALLGFACSSNDNPVTTQGQGVLTVNIHDQSSTDIAKALVTFESVQAVAADGTLVDVQGVTLGTPIDMTELINGKEITLASGALPAGDYIGLHLEISAISLELKDGTVVDLPVGGGLLVSINVSFTVEEGQETVITLDFPMTAFEFNGQFWTVKVGDITVD